MTKLNDSYFGNVTRLGAAVTLAAAVALTSVAPAEAQSDDRYDRDQRYDNGRGSDAPDVRRMAMANGYAAGYRRGVEARRQRNRGDYRRDDSYRQANEGYDARYDDRSNNQRGYQSRFRQAFARGFNDGYSGRQMSRAYGNPGGYGGYGNPGGYGGNGGYDPNQGTYNNGSGSTYVDDRRGNKDPDEVAQAAAQHGYRAGFERGQYDGARDARRANPKPEGHGAYQFALDGWDREWGSGRTYQQYYRQYFIQGYTDAYQRRAQNFRYRRN